MNLEILLGIDYIFHPMSIPYKKYSHIKDFCLSIGLCSFTMSMNPNQSLTRHFCIQRTVTVRSNGVCVFVCVRVIHEKPTVCPFLVGEGEYRIVWFIEIWG